MNANIASIYGAQIFCTDDKLLYWCGFSVACSILAVGLILAIVQFVDIVIHRRRKARQVESGDEDSTDKGNTRVAWAWGESV
jgi:hypothetical protein